MKSVEIRLLETAKEDLREGYWFYEEQSSGLGDYFLDCMQADVRSLHIFARVHATADGFYRMLGKRFPFAIYYLVNDEPVDVYATTSPKLPPSPWKGECPGDTHPAYHGRARRMGVP
jgi:hypothetical protein